MDKDYYINTPATAMIAEERRRQVSEEGWSHQHDDRHVHGELSDAAACYAIGEKESWQSEERECLFPLLWPWDLSWWKPCKDNRIKELVKAGALIAAEIERLQRLV